MNKFIDALRAEIEKHRAYSLETIIGGTLDPKSYGYACGYLAALSDVAKPRTKDQTDKLGMIEAVLHDMRKE